MTLLKRKQIDAIVAAWVKVSALSANGAATVITTQVTAALGTAGRGGSSVPVQVSAGEEGEGIVATGSNNRVEIWDNTTKEKISDFNGNEVYGRLTEATGTYTLTYYVLDGGTETAHSFASATDIDFSFIYRFKFEDLPADFATSLTAANVYQDPGGSGSGGSFREELTVSGTDTIGDLAKTPISGGSVVLYVNGKAESSVESPAPFTVATKAITWSAANAGYNVETTDTVVAEYATNE